MVPSKSHPKVSRAHLQVTAALRGSKQGLVTGANMLKSKKTNELGLENKGRATCTLAPFTM